MTREQYVVWLDITMHDTVLVRIGEGAQHIAKNPCRFLYRQLSGACEPGP